ncbi:2-phospho-L-lactate guanylyltransferase [Nitrosopumilus sp. b1]|uniref:2-phospho-L-lactate guanylyltransferase n=1 Tax=Nitrosopumilus sp. b1 TaxID=2109907 RepID=UPI0015F595ED|nr:2-phospho-L-lactate guanylyltransferase [Nitrosopumilus sp. b1]KAF6242536.1 2-phospho-L-lactate guanylyltransferase [Nitrosopumilus sp. b1]
MNISAIIPVKTFSKAKSRLDLPSDVKTELCKLMFDEVLSTLSTSPKINKIVVVSKDEDALSISKKYNAVTIVDKNESGVNNAVAQADKYLVENNFNASIVFPQDIPFMKSQDIDFLLKFLSYPTCSLVVPSRKFDGTNALLRMPIDLMETHYDEDSYKIHLETAKSKTPNWSLVFVRRIMMDIDTNDDLEYCMSQNEKPNVCEKISKLL